MTKLLNLPVPISTHAPAGGATRETVFLNLIAQFLLTPLREGRLEKNEIVRGGIKFLLTPLREGRLFCDCEVITVGEISTHAPAGGATVREKTGSAAKPDFYSRPCGRGDRRLPAASYTPYRFLLTPLREGRQKADAGYGGADHFYSRPCGRGDKETMRCCVNREISTHAPAGGATEPRRLRRRPRR